MPQIFQVLRCYKCLTFQVHHAKKSNKFACKICDEKQSIKRHYGIGIAKDCRMHVQKLNKMTGEKDETKLEDVSDDYEEAHTQHSTEQTSDTTDNVKRTSKWLSYIDKQIEETEIADNQIISETNHYNNIKRWPINNKYQNYKAKKNIPLKRRHCNDSDENDANDVILHGNRNTKNVFSKKPLFENGDDCRGVSKGSKQTSHYDIKLPRNNSELIDNNLRDCKNINKSPKLETTEVNKSSKWAQFIERDEDIGEENCDDEAAEKISKNIQPLFTLCDECDIDDVLDI